MAVVVNSSLSEIGPSHSPCWISNSDLPQSSLRACTAACCVLSSMAREASLPAASISSPSASSSASAAEMSTSSCASFLGAAERRFCCRRSWLGLYDVVGF